VAVLASDIDNLSHASNQVYLRWVLDAALAHSTAVGFPEETYIARGQAWVVRRHELEYVRPALIDQHLRVETRVTSMSVASCVRKTRIFRDDQLLLTASTDWVYVALPSGKPMRIPPDVRAHFPVEP
jgi:acyl-CoA thioester hydrolase